MTERECVDLVRVAPHYTRLGMCGHWLCASLLLTHSLTARYLQAQDVPSVDGLLDRVAHEKQMYQNLGLTYDCANLLYAHLTWICLFRARLGMVALYSPRQPTTIAQVE